MAKSSKDYFGLDYVVSLILTIIPFTDWICGIITRAKEGKWVATIIRIIPIFGAVAWILDIIFMVLNRRICRLFNI